MAKHKPSALMSEVLDGNDVIVKTKVSTKAHKDADAVLTNLELDISNCSLHEVIDGFKQTKVIQWQRANRVNLPANEATVKVAAEHAGKGKPAKSYEEKFDDMTAEEQAAEIEKLTKLMEK